MLGITFEETRVYQEARQEGRQDIVLLLLNQKFGAMPKDIEHRIANLSLVKLEGLTIALLNFAQIKDLTNWLMTNG